jgi:hypothetical protein
MTKRDTFFGRLSVMAIAAMFGALIGVMAIGGIPISAQSPRVLGRDVAGDALERWGKRFGLLNTNNGCDVALEYDSLNTAHVSDCTDAAGLADMKLRGAVLTGVPVSAQGVSGGDSVLMKKVTAIAQGVQTTVLSVTVPNAAHSATIPITINATTGAGGTIGAQGCTATARGQVVITRASGVLAVVSAVALTNTGQVCVAGGPTTMVLAYNVSSVSGGTTGVDTFNIAVTITANDTSTNHVALIQADVLNANASGITVS